MFDEETSFPTIKEAITVDKELHVQLQYCECPVPLSTWFVSGRSEKLTWLSMLQNFPAYLRNRNEIISKSLLSELFQCQYYKNQKVDHHTQLIC